MKDYIINKEQTEIMFKFFATYTPSEILEAYTNYISDQMHKMGEKDTLGNGIPIYTWEQLELILQSLVDVIVSDIDRDDRG